MPVAFIAAALLQGAAAAPPPRLPKDFDIRTHWPTTAHRAGIEGRTMVKCQVKPNGVMHGCTAISETPVGYGFGAAAVRAYEGEKLQPGAPGAAFPSTVRLPLNFTLKAYGPSIRVETHDGWTTVQQPDRWRDYYPGKARGDGVGGEVDVRCAAGGDGKVACEVQREEPAGHGFGEAALKVQRMLLLQPPPGGAKSTGRAVRFTVHFKPK